jgi:hypothetical protein
MRFKVRSRTLSWLLTVIMVMSLFINVSPLAAAETFTGTIPPTWQNGTLNAADVTGNSFTLSRTGAQDDAGGTGYKIYKNNSVMTPVDDAYTYGVSADADCNLRHHTLSQYQLLLRQAMKAVPVRVFPWPPKGKYCRWPWFLRQRTIWERLSPWNSTGT